MLINGDEVKKGDRVWHNSAGWGVVATIDNHSARVQMESGGILNMGDGGRVGFSQRFWWYPPAMLTPRKGMEATHRRAIAIAQTVVAMLEDKP